MAKKRRVYKSAVSGRFVSKRHVKRSPKTTFAEHVVVRRRGGARRR